MFSTNFGFSIKVGNLDTNNGKINPFRSNMNNDKKHGITVFELLEPLVDVFEETDHTLIIADMPGVNENDIHVDLKDDILQISTKTTEKNYQKEILLKESFTKDRIVHTYKNGILKISLIK
ncbi:MAG: Hsp20/alpha crystallin family protein [Planctomycetes bacterium]|nr:Hsp20/alpha crystallin family protein [Planctomycetota bacterium]